MVTIKVADDGNINSDDRYRVNIIEGDRYLVEYIVISEWSRSDIQDAKNTRHIQTVNKRILNVS